LALSQNGSGKQMNYKYVVDSSVFASILVKDEFYERAKIFVERFSGSVLTLNLALVEVANALWRHVYLLKRIPEDRYARLRDKIRPLIYASADVQPAESLVEEALDNAKRFGITIYDSLFVTLALKEGGRLVSFDEKLRKRIEEAGSNIVVVP